MITGTIKNKVDKIWLDVFAGGMTNPLTVIEQLTYLIFIRTLDEKEQETETMENLLGTKQSHGCIRLGVRNAYWVFNFVDAGTLGVCRAGGLSAPLRTLPQPLATTDVDPTDPGRTGNWGYTDSGATAYPVPGYIARG